MNCQLGFYLHKEKAEDLVLNILLRLFLTTLDSTVKNSYSKLFSFMELF